MATSKETGNKITGKINLAEFKTEPKATRFALANEIFKENPSEFISQALNISANQKNAAFMFDIPKEVVDMDDILTQQMTSTYRNEIVPLLIRYPETPSSTNN
jgi:hypothetical protein